MSWGLDGAEEVRIQALGRCPLRIYTDQVGKCVLGPVVPWSLWTREQAAGMFEAGLVSAALSSVVWVFSQCCLGSVRTCLSGEQVSSRAHLTLTEGRGDPCRHRTLFLNAPHLTCSLARWRPAAPATAFESFLADLGCRRLTAAPGQAPELLRDGDAGLPSTAIETYKGEGEALPTTWKGGPCPGSSQRWGKIVLC